ncbi:hypothetical protein TSAR_003430, partial [Trichomalopsis sarcophagae]
SAKLLGTSCCLVRELRANRAKTDNEEKLMYLKMILLIQVNALALYLLFDLEKNESWLNRQFDQLIPEECIEDIFAVFQELKENQTMFFKVTRMDVDTFECLNDCLYIYLLKPRSNISPDERLAITLRFLSTGDNINSIALNYRIGVSTCYNIIKETCMVIFEKLSLIYLQFLDQENNYGLVKNGLWRKKFNDANQPQEIDNIPLNGNALNAGNVRDMLANYFLTPEGEVPWQYEYVRRGSYNDFDE